MRNDPEIVSEAEHLVSTRYFRRFPNIESAEEWVASVCRSRWWRNRFPGKGVPRIRACATHKNLYATYYHTTGPGGEMQLYGRRSLRQDHLLHELAHHALPARLAGHDPEFCRVLIDLYHRWVGPGAGGSLEWFMRREGVEIATRPSTYKSAVVRDLRP